MFVGDFENYIMHLCFISSITGWAVALSQYCLPFLGAGNCVSATRWWEKGSTATQPCSVGEQNLQN